MYKKAQILPLAAGLMMVATASCKKDDVNNGPGTTPGGNKLQFTSSIGANTGTKATGNAWEANDAIGLFMNAATGGSGLAANKQFTTTGDGNFTEVGGPTTYPSDGSAVNFLAYYPYNAALTGTSYAVNVASQTNPAAIDLMYSSNATGFSKTSTSTPNLAFAHELSKLEITIKPGTGLASVAGVTAELQDQNTTASFDLATGTLGTGASPATINAKMETGGTDPVATAILLPLADAAGKKIIFTLNGVSYTWTLPAGARSEAGKKHSYTVALNGTAPSTTVVLLGAATITNWVDVPGGSTTLDPDVVIPPPALQTIFTESFGTADASANPSFTNYTGYDNGVGLTFSGSGQVRVTGNGMPTPGNTGRFSGSPDQNLKIEGINTSGFSNLKLSFKIGPSNTASASNNIDMDTIVTVSYNNSNYTFPSTVFSGTNTPADVQIDLSAAAASATGILEITGHKGAAAGTNGTFFRIDDLKLEGAQ
ncbi:fimbrillin family protein [Niabella aurantiaca]|uniref:fimbrillin family protein n=1 Tax=Niabella aurantiaca TaxID=379900 RepID=UPI0003718329|nr:fimbrillin family protein [Niabella aurantiaca]